MTNSGRTRVGPVIFYTSPKTDVVYGMVKIDYQFDFSSFSDDVLKSPRYKKESREVWFHDVSTYQIEQDIIDFFGDGYTIE